VILFFTGYFFENIVHCILYENLHEKICMQTKICRQIKIYIPQKIIDKKENKEFLIRNLVGTDPLTYDKKFMSDEIYEKVFNSENATQELRRIQYNIYSGLIKDIKNYQQILNDKK
jgi:hypothetical protein